jgi:hypothetical protein
MRRISPHSSSGTSTRITCCATPGRWDSRRSRANARRAPPDLFARILAEQVGPDGWHEERSPMYHARALRDALELEAAAAEVERPLDPATRERIRAMRDAMPWMRRGDGSLWTLNDAAQDLGVDLAALSGAAAPPAASGISTPPRSRCSSMRPPATASGSTAAARRRPTSPRTRTPARSGSSGTSRGSRASSIAAAADTTGIRGANTCAVRPRTTRSESANATRARCGRPFASADAPACAPSTGAWPTATARATSRSRPSAAAGPRRMRATSGRSPARTRTITVADRVEHARGRAVIGHLHCAPDWSVERAGDRALLLRHARATVHCTIEGDATITLHRGERSPDAGWHAHGFGNVVPAWTIRFTAPANAAAPAWRTILAPT